MRTCCRMVADLLIGLMELTKDSLSRRAFLPAGEVEAQLSLIKPMFKVCGQPPPLVSSKRTSASNEFSTSTASMVEPCGSSLHHDTRCSMPSVTNMDRPERTCADDREIMPLITISVLWEKTSNQQLRILKGSNGKTTSWRAGHPR